MNKKRIIPAVILSVALMIACVFGGLQAFASDHTATDSKGEIDVYLIAGQSNAVGFGSDGLSASILNDARYTDGFNDVLYYGVGESNVFNELVPVKVGLGKNATSVGAEVGIAAAVAGNGRTSAVIKHAIGGSYLYPTTDGNVSQNYGTWTSPSYIDKYDIDTNGNKMGDIYEDFIKTVTNGIKLLKAEGYTPVVKGVWWMQGEAETPYEARAKAYEELLTMLISDMRYDIGAIVDQDTSSLPFVMGKITRNPDPSYTPYEHVKTVNEAQIAVTSKVSNTFIVDTAGLKQLDSWHFCADAQHWLGEQFINTLATASGKYGVTINGFNTNMVGGGAKSEGEIVTVTFVPYENCTINSVKMKIGTADATDITLDENNSYTFVMPAAEVSFIAESVDPNAVETKYGIIPSKFSDAQEYPFILFKNGEMVNAFDNWHTFINGNSLTGCTLLLRRDYSTSEGGDAHGLRSTPELTIDLGEFTLTRGNNHLFQALGKNTTANTAVIRVINGTIKANYYKDGVTDKYATPLIVFNNQASSTVSDTFKFIFDGITFDVSEGRGIVDCYNDGTVGSKGEITLNNCTIDRGDSTKAMTLFSLADSGNKNDVSIIVNGGTLKASTLAGLTFVKLNEARNDGERAPDSMVFGEKLMTVELPSEYEVPNTFKITTSNGGYSPFNPTIDEVTGNKIYELANLKTEYGDIDPKYLSVTDYPFVVFKNGVFVYATAKWNELINTYLAKDEYKSGCTLLLRRDYNTKEGGDSWGLCNIDELTVDLGGFTFSRGDYHMFQAMGRDSVNHKTVITVKNGTLKATNDTYLNSSGQTKYPTPLVCFNKNSANASSTDTFEFVFNGVRFDVSAGRGIVDSFNDGSGSIEATVTLNNCIIYRGASTATMTVFNMSDTNSNNIKVVVNGGKIVVDKADGLKNITLAKFSSGSPSPDMFSIQNNPIVVVPKDVTIPDKVYAATGASYCLAKESYNNQDSTANYVFCDVATLVTTYGSIPTKYASKLDYPFLLYKNGTVIHAFSDWKVFFDTSVYRTDDYKSGCILLLRRDYSTSEASNNLWALSYIKDIVIDLGGHTMIRGNNHLFNAISHGATESTTTITVMNGTLKANFYKDDGKSSTSPVLCFNNDGNSSAVDKFFFNFNGVTFDVSTGRGIITCYTNGGAGSGTNNIVTLNNCTIYRGSSVSAMTLFGLREGNSNKNDISVVINGGKLEGDSLRSLTFATYDERDSTAVDSVKFGTDTEYGKFVITILTTSTAPDANTVWYTTNGIECVFVKKSSEAKTTTYTIYPSVMVDYVIKTSVTLYSNYVYNVYIPKANTNSFAINGKAVEYKEVEIDGVNYYHVAVNLPAGEALSDILLSVVLNTGDTTLEINRTLSVLKYAESVMSGEYNDTTKNLIKDMLVYASAAHTYFNNALDADKAAAVEALLDGYSAEMPEGVAKQPTSDTYFTKAAVYLGEVPSFRFYLADGYSFDDFSFEVGGRSVTATPGYSETNGYYIEVVMYAYMMLDDVTYTVKGTSITETYNLYSYYEYIGTLGEGYDNLSAIVEGLMKYSVSAKAYRDFVVNN